MIEAGFDLTGSEHEKPELTTNMRIRQSKIELLRGLAAERLTKQILADQLRALVNGLWMFAPAELANRIIDRALDATDDPERDQLLNNLNASPDGSPNERM